MRVGPFELLVDDWPLDFGVPGTPDSTVEMIEEVLDGCSWPWEATAPALERWASYPFPVQFVSGGPSLGSVKPDRMVLRTYGGVPASAFAHECAHVADLFTLDADSPPYERVTGAQRRALLDICEHRHGGDHDHGWWWGASLGQSPPEGFTAPWTALYTPEYPWPQRRYAHRWGNLSAFQSIVHPGEEPTVPEPDHTFADVKPDHPHFEGVEWAARTGIVRGKTPQTFAPNEYVTRGQLVSILHAFSNRGS